MATPSSVSLSEGPKLEIPEILPSAAPNQDSVSEKSQESSESTFNPGWRFLAAFASLSVITLMAALDATSISVALPVSIARADV